MVPGIIFVWMALLDGIDWKVPVVFRFAECYINILIK